MSPLWRDEIGVYAGPTKVVLARMKKGLRPKCVAEDGEQVSSANCGDWQPALMQLQAMLDSGDWNDANVRVVLSDHWMRYAELPASADLTGSDERLGYARHVINETYGDIADSWKIAISRNAPRQASIICAMPSVLIDEISELFAARGQNVLSIQPHLLVAYNGWRQKLSAKASWFAAIDEGLLSALHVSNGRCDRVRSVRISGDWETEMRRIQKLGHMARGIPAEGPLYVDAPVWVRDTASGSNTALEWLKDCGEPDNIAHKVSLIKGLYI